jgi:flagellar FliJ protein
MLRHAESARDRARVQCERARNAERSAADQAQALQAYRDDYQQRWRAEFGRGGTMPIVLCYQSFMARLTQAIEQQRQLLQQLFAGRTRAEAVLLECERKVASTRKLIERRLAEQQQVAARRERKHDDELAARHALARRATRLSAPTDRE